MPPQGKALPHPASLLEVGLEGPAHSEPLGPGDRKKGLYVKLQQTGRQLLALEVWIPLARKGEGWAEAGILGTQARN